MCNARKEKGEVESKLTAPCRFLHVSSDLQRDGPHWIDGVKCGTVHTLLLCRCHARLPVCWHGRYRGPSEESRQSRGVFAMLTDMHAMC